ncbi:MAG: nucleotidyltransferase family protein [Candidatus Dormibacteria bacterium]
MTEPNLSRQPLVLLAAGRSARMGSPKPLLRWRDATLLEHACRAAREGGAGPVLVVAEDPQWLRERAGEVGEVTWVACPTAARGQAESLRAGLTAALRAAPASRAVLVGLVDQVGLRAEAVGLILDAVGRGGANAWAADYDGERRIPAHPVALGPPTWPLVERLRGDVGARGILSAQGAGLAWVPMPPEWRPVDCDTPADYRRLLASVTAAAAPGHP